MASSPAMALTVVVRTGDLPGHEGLPTLSFDSPRLVIGRGEGCDIRLPDPSVSHRHASIRQRGSDYLVVDEGSTNGTYVASVRLPPQSPRLLRSGELIRVGRVWLEVKLEAVVPTANPAMATKEIALALVQGALEAQGETTALRVAVVEGPDQGRALDIVETEQPHLLGRARDVQLLLDDADASRHHVELLRRGDRLYVRDLNSKNGSALAGEPMPPDKELAWSPKDELQIGANVLRYADPVASALEELEAAADEHMRADESIDPPTSEEKPPEESEASEPDPLSEVALGSEPKESRRVAPIAEKPKKKAKPKGGPPGGARRWGSADLLIAMLAIGVLALSVMGMIWLMRAG